MTETHLEQSPVRPCGVVTLTTDFGLRDSYVSVMKGVMLELSFAESSPHPASFEQTAHPTQPRAPQLQMVDVTHAIAPQNVAAGRYHLAQAVPFFPKGTVHLAVVDPGVGGNRRPVAVECDRGWLVGPDNGLFTAVLEQFPPRRAVELNRPAFWRRGLVSGQASSTFHGRDIFAPAAAHLSMGVDLDSLGDTVELTSLVQLDIQACSKVGDRFQGSIQHIDHFGNLITTLPGEALTKTALNWSVQLPNRPGRSILTSSTYDACSRGDCLALVASHGWVEIAVSGGSAAGSLGAQIGDPVILTLQGIGPTNHDQSSC